MVWPDRLSGAHRPAGGRQRWDGLLMDFAALNPSYNLPICLNASPTAIAHAIATLTDRIPGRIGMRSRTSAA